MRPKRLICLVFALIFLLSGCIDSASLYALPRTGVVEDNVMDALEAVPGYEVLTLGDGSEIFQADLTGDGEEDAAAFMSDGKSNARLFLISGTTTRSFDCAGPEIVDAGLEDLTGDQVPELLVVSGLPGVSARVLQIFGMKDDTFDQLFSEPCHRLELYDLNKDGLREAYCIGDNGTKCQVTVFLPSGGGLHRTEPIPMWFTYEGMSQISTACLSDGTEVLLISGILEDGSLYTEPLRIGNGEAESLAGAPHKPVLGLFQSPIRSYHIYPQDIDGDGDTDFPVARELPQYSAGATVQYVIDWYDYAVTGAQGVSTVTYHNFGGGWYLKIPETWWNDITIRELDLTTTLSTVVIYRLTDKGAEEFLTVYEVEGEDRQTFVEEENLTILRSDTERTLALGLSRKAQRLDETVTTASIAERFFVPDEENNISGNAE